MNRDESKETCFSAFYAILIDWERNPAHPVHEIENAWQRYVRVYTKEQGHPPSASFAVPFQPISDEMTQKLNATMKVFLVQARCGFRSAKYQTLSRYPLWCVYHNSGRSPDTVDLFLTHKREWVCYRHPTFFTIADPSIGLHDGAGAFRALIASHP